jgi:hypothetical protein
LAAEAAFVQVPRSVLAVLLNWFGACGGELELPVGEVTAGPTLFPHGTSVLEESKILSISVQERLIWPDDPTQVLVTD